MELTAANFQRIKSFILRHGDRQTYCNMYNRNPHYDFGAFQVYLDPDVGQQNINCDPELSDFSTLVVQDWKARAIYVRWSVDGERMHFNGSRGALTQYVRSMLERVQQVEP